MESYLNLSLPFGLAPTEATIGSYRQKPSARALHRVYSVEATFGSEKRCFHRYETGGEPWPVSAASSHQLSPHWHKASGSESKKKMLHSVAEYGARGRKRTEITQIHWDFDTGGTPVANVLIVPPSPPLLRTERHLRQHSWNRLKAIPRVRRTMNPTNSFGFPSIRKRLPAPVGGLAARG